MTLSDGYTVSFRVEDGKEQAADYLQTQALAPEMTEKLLRAKSTCTLVVSVMGDNDMDCDDGEDHFNEWLYATAAFSNLPSAIGVDLAVLHEFEERNAGTTPPPPATPPHPAALPEPSAKPWWKRLLGRACLLTHPGLRLRAPVTIRTWQPRGAPASRLDA